MKQHKTDILIIGLGLAGMTAAITAAKSGKKITIITNYKFPKSDKFYFESAVINLKTHLKNYIF